MKEWEGVISKKSERDWHSVKLYSFQIEGVDRWFRTGKTEIEQPVGATVSFTERNSQVDVATIQEVSGVPQSLSQSDVASADVQEPTSSPPTVADRIRWQEARRDAVTIITAALHNDALPWAANVAKGKKLDLLRGYINELAGQFMEEENAKYQ